MTRKNKTHKPASDEGRFSYDGLNRVIHEKARLGILASLAAHEDGLVFNDLKQLCSHNAGHKDYETFGRLIHENSLHLLGLHGLRVSRTFKCPVKLTLLEIEATGQFERNYIVFSGTAMCRHLIPS